VLERDRPDRLDAGRPTLAFSPRQGRPSDSAWWIGAIQLVGERHLNT
jgi:hypothetical protein